MRRRTISIHPPAGRGAVAGIEFGDASRSLDILFLHANGFNAHAYSPILAPLAGDMRVLAVDLRGHGLSSLPVPSENPGWRLYADDLIALIAALGEVPRVLAGHSMGGTAALLAAPFLSGVARLVLFDPVIGPAGQYGRQTQAAARDMPMAQGALRRRGQFASRDEAFAAYQGRGAFRTWPDETLHAYLQDGLLASSEGGLALACTPAWEADNFAAYAVDDPWPALRGLATPAHILRAGHGSTCAVDDAAGQAACVTVETLAGTSHFLPMERPVAVRSFLLAAAGPPASRASG